MGCFDPRMPNTASRRPTHGRDSEDGVQVHVAPTDGNGLQRIATDGNGCDDKKSSPRRPLSARVHAVPWILASPTSRAVPTPQSTKTTPRRAGGMSGAGVFESPSPSCAKLPQRARPTAREIESRRTEIESRRTEIDSRSAVLWEPTAPAPPPQLINTAREIESRRTEIESRRTVLWEPTAPAPPPQLINTRVHDPRVAPTLRKLATWEPTRLAPRLGVDEARDDEAPRFGVDEARDDEAPRFGERGCGTSLMAPTMQPSLAPPAQPSPPLAQPLQPRPPAVNRLAQPLQPRPPVQPSSSPSMPPLPPEPSQEPALGVPRRPPSGGQHTRVGESGCSPAVNLPAVNSPAVSSPAVNRLTVVDRSASAAEAVVDSYLDQIEIEKQIASIEADEMAAAAAVAAAAAAAASASAAASAAAAAAAACTPPTSRQEVSGRGRGGKLGGLSGELLALREQASAVNCLLIASSDCL